MSSLRPDSNKGHDLGSSSVKWGTVYVGDVQAETMTTSGNVEIQGNLTVTGTQTSLQVSTVEAEDPLIKLARGNTGDAIDIGFYGLSNDGSDKYHGLARDADDGKFYLFKDVASEPSTTLPSLSAGNKATIVADLQGNVTGSVTGNADTASALETSRTLSISGDAAGSVSFDGSANADIALTIAAGAVENSMLANSSITFGDASTTEALSLGDTVKWQGTANEVEVSYATGTNTFTVGLPSSISGLTSISSTGFTGALTGNASTASSLETSRTLSVSGDATGSASFDGSANADIALTIAAGAVENGMLVNDGWGLKVDGVSKEDINLGDSLDFSGTASQVAIAYDAVNNDLTFSLPSTINVDTSGNAATATALETSRTFSIASGPVTASGISFDGTGNVSLTSSIANGALGNALLENSTTSFTDGTTSSAIALGGSLTIQGTANEVDVSNSAGVFTIGLPSTIQNDTSGNAATATALQTSRTFSIGSGPVTASGVSFDGTGNVSLTSSIAAGAITNEMLDNNKLVINVGGTDYDRELGTTLVFAKGGDLTVGYSAGVVTYTLPGTLTANTSGNAATATALETSRDIQLTGDITGSASFNGTANASISTTIANGAVDNVMLANSSITVSDTSNSEAISLGDTLYFGGTSNEVEVGYSSSINKFTFGLPDNVNITTNLDVGSGLTVGGNATITGNISAAGLTASGANVTFADNLIELGVNNTDLEDIGFYGQRGDGIGGANGFAGFAFDESADKFIAFTSTGEPTTSVGAYTPAAIEVGDMEVASIDCVGVVAGQLRAEGSAPTSATDTGTAGDIRYDSAYLYICVDTDTWKRVAITGW